MTKKNQTPFRDLIFFLGKASVYSILSLMWAQR